MKKRRWLSLILALAVLVTSFALPAPTKAEAADTNTYWVKVNRQANVVTVYKKSAGKYKPIKAMLCSCGGSNTPLGTFRTPAKYRWHTLMGPSYGQYCTRIHGGVLFHSVWYYQNGNKATQSTVQFNKLGTTASHGCVRLSVADSKWIYDNCPLGTKVTVYASSNPGPLGKPKGIKVSTSRRMGWDPTDPDPKNPYTKNMVPSISVSKKKARTVQYGAKYSVKSGVSAKQKDGKNLTKSITYSVAIASRGKWKAAKFSTRKLGTYRIRYKVKNAIGQTAQKDIKVKVVDTNAPIIKGAKSRSVFKGYSTNLLSGVSMKMRSGTNRIKAAKVTIRNSKNKVVKTLSYNSARKYKFTADGKYKVTYTVKNKNKPYRAASKSVTYTVYTKKKPTLSANNIVIDARTKKLSEAEARTLAKVKSVNYKKTNISSKVQVLNLSKVNTKVPGKYKVTYQIKDSIGTTQCVRYITVMGSFKASVPKASDIKDITSFLNADKVNADSVTQKDVQDVIRKASTEFVTVKGALGTKISLNDKAVTLTVGSAKEVASTEAGFAKVYEYKVTLSLKKDCYKSFKSVTYTVRVKIPAPPEPETSAAGN